MKDRSGVGLEGQQHRFAVQFCRTSFQQIKHSAVPYMDPIKGSNGQYHRDFRRKIACVEIDFHFCKDRLVISRISLYFCAEFNWRNRPLEHASTRNHSPGHRTGCRCKFSAGSCPPQNFGRPHHRARWWGPDPRNPEAHRRRHRACHLHGLYRGPFTRHEGDGHWPRYHDADR